MSRRGSRGGKGRKGSQKEAQKGQRSSNEPRCAQAQSQPNPHGVSLPPRPPPVHESPMPRLQGAKRPTNAPAKKALQQPYRSDESDISYHPPPSGPESFHRDYNLRAHIPSPIMHVPSSIMSSQLHDDPWAGRGYNEFPRDERHMISPQAPPVDNSRVPLHGLYRQRTPEYHRSHESEIAQMRPSFEGRGPPSSRMSSDVRRRQSRSMSPTAGPTRSSGNPALVVASASVANSTRIGEPYPSHIGDEQKKEAQQIKCGNCKGEGHEVKDCVSKIGPTTGCVMACPRCNSNRHLYERCPSPHAPAVGTREREEDDLYYLLTCRQNKPQIRAYTDLAALVRWTTPSLAAFPWTPAFALRYHADPQQAAAERDYNYSKHDFGPDKGGRRPDREALTRKFDPSHPAIPKIPVPTLLVVPPTPQENESHQRTTPHNRPALVDTVMNDVNTPTDVMFINSGKPTPSPSLVMHLTKKEEHRSLIASTQGTGGNGTIAAHQQLDSPFRSSAAAHTWNPTSTTVWPPNRGDSNNNGAAAPGQTPTARDDGDMRGDLGTKGPGDYSKAAPASTGYGGYSDTWEAYVAAEIERIERKKSLVKKTSEN